MPSLPDVAPGAIKRRDVLAGAIGMTVLAVTASACTSEQTPPVEVLAAQLQSATGDADLARRAAAGAAGQLAQALTQIATERTAHATALSTEIARAAGQSTTTGSTSPTTTTGAPSPPPSAGDVLAALQRSADSATALVATLSGYRAGLVGSIAASCKASAAVSLAGVKAAA